MDWVWLAVFVIVMGLELVGLRRRNDKWPTLTDVVRKRIMRRGLGWAMAAFLGWLSYHWLVEMFTQR